MKCRVKGLAPEKLKNDLIRALDQANKSHFEGNLTFNRYPEINGNFVHFTLRVKDSSGKGARFSRHRKLISACYHAHFFVMAYLFDVNPTMILKSALADYYGQSDFYDKFTLSGCNNVGSMAQPLFHADSCHCEYSDVSMLQTFEAITNNQQRTIK